MNEKKPSQLDYPSKIALSLLVFITAAAALVYFLIIPAANSIETIKLQMDRQSQELQKDYSQGQSLKILKANLESVQPKVGEIDQIFFDMNDTNFFVNSLANAAAKNDVTERPTLGGESSLGQFYSQIPLQVAVKGSFSGLIGFFADLETLNKYINFNSLTIQPAETPPGNGTSTPQKILNGLIYATTYWKN